MFNFDRQENPFVNFFAIWWILFLEFHQTQPVPASEVCQDSKWRSREILLVDAQPGEQSVKEAKTTGDIWWHQDDGRQEGESQIKNWVI